MEINFEKAIREGVNQAMKDCELKIGMTLKECVEKQIPKKIQRHSDFTCFCEDCGNEVKSYQEYCYLCGQKLDWSEIVTGE